MGGYIRKLAYVDLTMGKITLRKLSQEECHLWIGGSGLGVKILMEESNPQVDPLGADNPLIFMTGPMTGTCIPASGRHQVITKSPLTGIYGEADAGGDWGAMLKRAGFDGLVIKGQADRPVYLAVSNGKIHIIDATSVWGLDTYDTDTKLKEIHGSEIAVASIGPAGERKVLLATIMNEGKKARSAGRGGLGAVMGAKRLKAIVVAGEGPIPINDEYSLGQSINAVVPMIEKRTKSMSKYGTAGGISGAEKIGDLPLKNWSQGSWSEAEKISGQVMSETMVTGNNRCHSCPIGCGRSIKAKSRHGNVDGAGPEYETLGMFGGACLIADLPAIAKANELCNRYGMDTISTGSAIAFLMELYEKGLIQDHELSKDKLDDTLLPVWGNADALIWLIHAIANQEGIGKIIGQGVRKAAAIIGGRAPEFAFHVKGLEMPAHDPRAFNSLALGYATSNRGACHLQGGSYFFEKIVTLPEIGINQVLDRFRRDNQGNVQARQQDIMCLMDSLKLCKFLFYGGINLTIITEWLNHLTGFDYSVEELLLAGERIFNIKRLYNVKCGITRSDDSLPRRILEETRPDGGAAGNLPPLGHMLEEYYEARGWDTDGRPSLATITRLGLSEWQ